MLYSACGLNISASCFPRDHRGSKAGWVLTAVGVGGITQGSVPLRAGLGHFHTRLSTTKRANQASTAGLSAGDRRVWRAGCGLASGGTQQCYSAPPVKDSPHSKDSVGPTWQRWADPSPESTMLTVRPEQGRRGSGGVQEAVETSDSEQPANMATAYHAQKGQIQASDHTGTWTDPKSTVQCRWWDRKTEHELVLQDTREPLSISRPSHCGYVRKHPNYHKGQQHSREGSA